MFSSEPRRGDPARLAIGGAASLVLAFGEQFLSVPLEISNEGHVRWPGLVSMLAGAAAVSAYAVRLAVPIRALASVVALGAVLIAQGLGPASADLDRNTRTLVAALVIGVVGRLLARRFATYQRHRVQVSTARIASRIGLRSTMTGRSSGKSDPDLDAPIRGRR